MIIAMQRCCRSLGLSTIRNKVQWTAFRGHSQCRAPLSTKAATGTVGFLGLGNMGLPMARNLAQSREVLAFDLNDRAMNQAQQFGIAIAESVQEVASSASTIVSMLPSDAAVNNVLQQVVEHCGEHTIMTVIDCSTVSPTTSRYWYDLLKEDGHLFVDAPVSGGVKGAEQASLTFMVGSDEVTLKEQHVEALLDCMGQRIIACGGPGAGAAVKLCNNLALATQMVGICEAMNLGEALGIDPVVLANVMNTSTAKSWSCEVNNPHPAVASLAGSPASNDYIGGFGTRLMLKDLGLAVSAGSIAHVALPLGNATKELYQLAEARGLGDKDFGIMLQFLRGQ